jgi:hypothetical protein
MLTVALLLKLTLAPALVALATLATRRWGAHVGGVLVAFPLVAGPLLVFLAIEQGPEFTSRAAVGTLAGLTSLSAFIAAYMHLAVRRRWPVAFAAGLAAFAACTTLLAMLPMTWYAALALAWLSLFAAHGTSPKVPPEATAIMTSGPELLARMAATAGLVLTVTLLAEAMGPRLCGLVSAFPVATTVMCVYTHRHAGAGAAVMLLRGLLVGLYSFSLFCLSVALLLPRTGTWQAFALALAVSVSAQCLLIAASRRTSTQVQ